MFALATLNGKVLPRDSKLAEFGLGSLLANWQLKVISLGTLVRCTDIPDNPEATEKLSVRIAFPPNGQFETQELTEKDLKVNASQPSVKVIADIFSSLKLSRASRFQLVHDETVIGDSDTLSSLTSSDSTSILTLRLQEKYFPSKMNALVASDIVNDLVNNSLSVAETKRRTVNYNECRSLLMNILEDVMFQTDVARTLEGRIPALNHLARRQLVAFLHQKETENGKLHKLPISQRMASKTRMIERKNGKHYYFARVGSIKVIPQKKFPTVSLQDILSAKQRINSRSGA